jgi:3'-phosphoadenosine 5'-phosphosulfate sulfotransferase (PAPS reductase)/FAD synthetase
MKHIVALSGGKDSTAMAIGLTEIEPREYEYVCTPTGNELPEMRAHWDRLAEHLGKPLIKLPTQSLASLIYRQNALPNWRMRWCTRMLKIEPFESYILENQPCTVYVGIRADETDREGVAYEKLSDGILRRYPLVEWGWGKGDVLRILERCEITIPERTDCAVCFFQTLWEWYQLWLNHRETFFQQGIEWERFTGHTLRSDQRDTWPASLEGLAEEFERGRIPKKRQTMKDRKVMCSVCAR